MDTAAKTTTVPVRRGSPLEVLRIFVKLGLTCFGGFPIAHKKSKILGRATVWAAEG